MRREGYCIAANFPGHKFLWITYIHVKHARKKISRLLILRQDHNLWPHLLQLHAWKRQPCVFLLKVGGSLSAQNCHEKGSELISRIRSCGYDRQVIVSHKKFLQFPRCLHDKRSELLDPQLDDNVFGFHKLSSASNFGERNFCLAKFSRYTVVWLLRQDSYQTSCLSVVKWSRSC